MLQALRDAWTGREVDETLAWSCLATNLLVLPGLGSLVARRRVEGLGQAVLALGGTALALYWLVSFGREWMRTEELPTDGGPDFAYGLLGVAVFAVGWLWSLVTSLLVVRAVRRPR
jgi:hypothetical protein